MTLQVVKKRQKPDTKAFDELVPGEVFRLNQLDILKLDGDLFLRLDGMHTMTTIFENGDYRFVYVNALMVAAARKLEIAIPGNCKLPSIKKSTRVTIIPAVLHLHPPAELLEENTVAEEVKHPSQV